jgi:hypothetical protein
VFFDSVDNLVSLKQARVDELIHGLIMVAGDPQVRLRVVVAGREAEQFAYEQGWISESDSTSGLFSSDVDRWLRMRAAEEGGNIDEAKLAAKLEELFPPSGPLPEPRRIGPRLPAILREVTRQANGA